MDINTYSNEPVDSKIFDTLFEKDVKGKLKQWSIKVREYRNFSNIVIVYGYVGGKMVESVRRVECGKNLGKSNETTHFQQAILEATSKWKKKCDTGFSPKEKNNQNDNNQNDNNQNDNSQNDNNQNTKQTEKIIELSTKMERLKTNEIDVTFPMLALDFKKYKHKLSYPVYVQPKLDGYRMLYNSKTNTTLSRQGKEFTAIKNTKLYKELHKLSSQNIILDGELYVHNGIFENLGILRKKKLSKQDIEKLSEIEYHVYDIVDTNTIFENRISNLKNLFEKFAFEKVKLVKTFLVNSQDDLENEHKNHIDENYEGSIVRTRSGNYRCKARSQDLLKYKDFEDAEYKIIGFSSEQDTQDKHNELVVWICETENGTTFNVRPKGTKEERSELFKRGDEFIGQQLYVKFFELTEGKVPRFPTTKTETYKSYIRNIIE